MHKCPKCKTPLRQTQSGKTFFDEWHCLQCRGRFYPEDLDEAKPPLFNTRLRVTLALWAISFLSYAIGLIVGRYL